MFRLIFFILMAVGLGGFGTVAWIATRPPATARPAAPPTLQILAAARPLDAGNLLKPEDIIAIRVPQGKEGADVTQDSAEGREALAGAMLLHGVGAQAILRSTDLLRPGDRGFLAAALQPGMRAVTVGVDAITGTAGLIWPGDHVDLILTQAFAGSLPAEHRVAAETVLSNVRVIAIDRRLVQGASASNEPQARTVTLEVTPDDAERVSVAVHLGRLSLSVRSAQVGPVPQPAPPAAWAGDVSAILHDDHASDPADGRFLTLYQGGADGKEIHY